MSTVDMLEQIPTMSEAELAALPLGVIRLDRAGTILSYNDAEAKPARRSARAVGLNFFRDVAPCTAVKEFQGRFNNFITQSANRSEPFSFLFRFGWGGEREVTITMVKRNSPEERIYIVVSATDMGPI
jgi:photoactive yellow protein